MNRREFIRTAIAATTLLAVGATGVFELAGKVVANQSNQQQTVQPVQPAASAAPVGYVLVSQLSSLAGKSSMYFTHPTYGSSILINLNGQWKAFSAVCTHRPCTVGYQNSEIYCPCHGATYSASNGDVTGGPAPTKLMEYGVMEQNGALYVSDATVN